MSKHTVEVLDAVVDGKKKGEKLDIDTKSAKYLESIHYVKVLKPVKEEQKEDEPEKVEQKEDSDGKAKQGDSEGHEAQEKQKEKGQKKK